MFVPFAIVLLPAAAYRLGRRLLALPQGAAFDAPAPPGNPIALLPALGFVAFVAARRSRAAWAPGRFGERGIAALLLIIGSMNVDVAIVTLGGLSPEAISPLLAAMAIAGTIIVNMAVKIGITLVYARARAGRRRAR